MIEKWIKLTSENPHVIIIELWLASDLDPKTTAIQRSWAIGLLKIELFRANCSFSVNDTEAVGRVYMYIVEQKKVSLNKSISGLLKFDILGSYSAVSGDGQLAAISAAGASKNTLEI